MKIDFLMNHPDKVKDVSEMIYNEFVLKADSEVEFKDVTEYFSNTYREKFPITLVALENEECIGTVSIYENDLKIRKKYKPWLASLYTSYEHRNKGVGYTLVNETIKVAGDLGFSEIYLRTEDASDYYRRRGWTFVETVADEKYDKIDVFKMKCD